MTYLIPRFLFFSCLSLLLSVSRAGSRPPHGPIYENPTASSPAAYEFFHPKAQGPETERNACSANGCSPLPMAAKVEADTQGRAVSAEKHGIGITGIVFGLTFAAFLAMGIYFVMAKRRANIIRANAIQPDA